MIEQEPAMTLDEFLKLPGAKVHTRKRRPVPVGTKVDTWLRVETPETWRSMPELAENLDWANTGGSWDIIAYREVQP